MRTTAACLATLLFASSAGATPKVVTSIMPVHSIVANVMGGVGAPELLLSGKNSEHTASLTPQQISGLGQADIVFMVGSGLEHKLGQISGTDSVRGKIFISLSEAPGIRTLKIRQGGTFEADEHEEHHDDPLLKFDSHIWLDPQNAKAMATAVANELGRIDPEHAAAYTANATAYLATLDRLTAEISSETQPLQGKPFIVFHDAYQYFEKAFGLTVAGSISDASAAAPSAKRLKEIRDKLAEAKTLCVFREPQFDAKYVDVVLEGSPAKQGVLDPTGYDLAPGPKAYEELMHNMATSLRHCLAG